MDRRGALGRNFLLTERKVAFVFTAAACARVTYAVATATILHKAFPATVTFTRLRAKPTAAPTDTSQWNRKNKRELE